MHPGRGESDDEVAGPAGLAGNDLVVPLETEHRPREVEPVHEPGEGRRLTADDREVREPRPLVQPAPERGHLRRVDVVGGDVVDERDRLEVHHVEVVHVHRDAVDPDRGPVLHRIRDQHLGPHAVGGECEDVCPELDQPGEVAEPTDGSVRSLAPVGQLSDERRDAVGLEADVDARIAVRPVIRHRTSPIA
ncbi:hypothetical protein DSECCO2_575430 [anaerobic digester metagenome]